MLLKVSKKAERPRLRGLLHETLELAHDAGIDATDLEVRVYGSPPGKRKHVGVFQYVEGWVKWGEEWRKVSGRILLQPRRGATDSEIVLLFAYELAYLRDFQDDHACCSMDRDEKERHAREFAAEVFDRWERGRASGRLVSIDRHRFQLH